MTYVGEMTSAERQTCLKVLHLCMRGFGHPEIKQETIDHYAVLFDLEAPLTGPEVALLCRKLHFLSDWARRHKKRELQADLNRLADHLRQPTLQGWNWGDQSSRVPA